MAMRNFLRGRRTAVLTTNPNAASQGRRWWVTTSEPVVGADGSRLTMAPFIGLSLGRWRGSLQPYNPSISY